MQILKIKDTIPFMSIRKGMMTLSGVIILAAIVSFFTKGLNWGLDFTGGTLIEVGFEQPADIKQVRVVLTEAGYKDPIVQNFGSSRDIMVRLPVIEGMDNETIGNNIMSAIQKIDPGAQMRRIEFVGPSVGDELREQGGLAMLTALLCILVYVAMRFEWRFALGSVVALAHDVLLTIALFSVTGIEFDLTVLAAVLAVIGYSLNDTIVVSDRIRENFRKLRNVDSQEIIDISLTQTLNRTLVTSLTTILVLVALFFKGGPIIHGFATALLFGVVIGTYSSIYIASSVALSLGISKEDMIPAEIEKEGADQEALMP